MGFPFIFCMTVFRIFIYCCYYLFTVIFGVIYFMICYLQYFNVFFMLHYFVEGTCALWKIVFANIH